ncbi:MAG TPA: glycosyltransferase [Gemmatimonadales bacterium]|nr:glycosyltransferase [Gemmatimonadales bacterium]
MERVLQALPSGQSRRGHRVRVALVVRAAEERDAFVAPLLAAGVEVDVLRLPARAYLRERHLIRELCARFRPDVVHTHGYRPDVLDAGIARSMGVPTVTTVHGSSRTRGRVRLYELVQFVMFRKFDAVVAVSRPLVRSLTRFGVPRHRIHVVPNAWDGRAPGWDRHAARDALGAPPDRFLIGWVGRLIPVKAADVFLRALAALRDVPWFAAVVGDGTERCCLERLAAGLGLSGRVAFHGNVDDAARLFPAFDVFVLSSRTEGTPIVLFEAMAAGVPVVATAVGGVPDVVSGTEALLVPAEDPGELAQAIRTALLDPGAARARVTAARARLTRDFTVDRWVARYDAVYQRVVRRCGEREVLMAARP